MMIYHLFLISALSFLIEFDGIIDHQVRDITQHLKKSLAIDCDQSRGHRFTHHRT